MPCNFDDLAKMKSNIAKTGRFVLLKHSVPETFRQATGRGDHFDLMLESSPESALWTWAMDKNVFDGDGGFSRCQADRLPDHRRIYLNFEGAVSGGRGSVKQIGSGTFSVLESSVGLTLAIVSGCDDVAGELVLTQSENNVWSLEFQRK